MGNTPNSVDFSQKLSDFLADNIDDGDYADLLEALKVDQVPAAATQQDTNAGQLWTNLIDDYVRAQWDRNYKAAKLWQAQDIAARNGLGFDDDLAVDDICYVRDSHNLWYCVSVDGPTSSSWLQVGGGGGGADLATTLALGNTTSGTNIEVSDGDGLVTADAAGVDAPNLPITTGSVTSGTGGGGDVLVTTGDGSNAIGGNFITNTGTGDLGGAFQVNVGASAEGPGNLIDMRPGDAGTSAAGNFNGGSLFVRPGDPVGTGQKGKLIVEGAVEMGQSATPPTPTIAGDGALYVESGTEDLHYVNASGDLNISNIASGTLTLSGEWRFSTTTTMADPGAGRFRFNNATQASATQLALSVTNDAGKDVGNFLKNLIDAGWDIYVQNGTDSDQWHKVSIDSAPTDNGSWVLYDITVDASGPTPLVNNGLCGLVFVVEAGSAPDVEPYTADKSTGVFSGGVMTNVNTGVSPDFTISAGQGWICDDTTTPSTLTKIEWGVLTPLTPPDIATQSTTWIGLENTGTPEVPVIGVVYRQDNFSLEERRSILALGRVIHTDNATLTADPINIVVPSYGIGSTLADYLISRGSFNETGNMYGPNGANLSIDKTAGTSFELGGNNSNRARPNITTDPADTLLTFGALYREVAVPTSSSDFGIDVPRTTIDPNVYDNGGPTPVAMSNNYWQVMRIYYFPKTSTHRIHYGQAEYQQKSQALAAFDTETFYKDPFLGNAVFRARLVVQQGATDLSNPAQAEFFEVLDGAASGTGGGGGATEWTQLSDTPGSYVGNADKFSHVNDGETGLEFATVGETEVLSNEAQINAVEAPGEVELSLGPATNQFQWTAGVVDYIDRSSGQARREQLTVSAGNLTVASIGTLDKTYVWVNKTAPNVGTVVQESAPPDATQSRNDYYVGWVKHGLTTLTQAFNVPTGRADEGFTDRKLKLDRGTARAISWTGFGENTGLTLSQADPITWSMPGVAYHSGSSDPNKIVTAAAVAPLQFDVIFQSGRTHLINQTVIPLLYEASTDTTSALPPNVCTYHRLIGFPDGSLYLQLGGSSFFHLWEAENAIKREQINNPVWDGVKDGGAVLAWVVVRSGATDWSDEDGKILNVLQNSDPDAIPKLEENVFGAFKWADSGSPPVANFSLPQDADSDLELVEVLGNLATAPTTSNFEFNIEYTPPGGGPAVDVLPSNGTITVGFTSVTVLSMAFNLADKDGTFQPVVRATDASATDLRISLRVISKGRNNP